MSAGVTERLTSLRDEFDKGQTLLAELDTRRERLKESMLRIAGAVQILEEMEGDGEAEKDVEQADAVAASP